MGIYIINSDCIAYWNFLLVFTARGLYKDNTNYHRSSKPFITQSEIQLLSIPTAKSKYVSLCTPLSSIKNSNSPCHGQIISSKTPEHATSMISQTLCSSSWNQDSFNDLWQVSNQSDGMWIGSAYGMSVEGRCRPEITPKTYRNARFLWRHPSHLLVLLPLMKPKATSSKLLGNKFPEGLWAGRGHGASRRELAIWGYLQRNHRWLMSWISESLTFSMVIRCWMAWPTFHKGVGNVPMEWELNEQKFRI